MATVRHSLIRWPAFLIASILFAGCAGVSAREAESPVAMRGEEAITFTPNAGEAVEAYAGAFSVPENRAAADSRTLTLRYVRFPATGDRPGAPIVYLAGGPGGSGILTAKGRRFPLFMAMRAFGDVIALDQRGVGQSDETPRCVTDVVIPDDERLPPAETQERLLASVRHCETFWREAGVDIRGYTTVESARDLDALRAHLGAEKVTLWGISYGTHLALAAMREMEGRIDRAILASVEGLDQTVKSPARTDAYFDRLQAAIDADPKAKAAYPDIKAMIAGVHAKLDAEPVILTLKTAKGEGRFLLDRETMRRIASALIADPESAAMLLQLYAAADAGVYEPVAGALSRFVTPGEPLSWRVMPLAMDVASGITPARLERVRREAETALLGDVLNFPMPHLNRAIEGLDLGDDFRAGPVSAVPTLLLSGTLDGRTYPESQREAAAGLSDLSVVTVVNAGHNLFMTTPEVTAVIESFMRGEKIGERTIEAPAPVIVK